MTPLSRNRNYTLLWGSQALSEVGFNAASSKYENLTESGVIDPTKVVRFAIQNASSIAGLMLTTEAVVAEIPEKKKDAPMPPGGGGMEDY